MGSHGSTSGLRNSVLYPKPTENSTSVGGTGDGGDGDQPAEQTSKSPPNRQAAEQQQQQQQQPPYPNPVPIEKQKSEAKARKRSMKMSNEPSIRWANHRHIQEALSEISMHFRETYRSPNWFWSVIWSLVWILSIVFCCVQLYRQTRHFFHHTTQTSNQIELENRFAFPAITVCTENWVKPDIQLASEDIGLRATFMPIFTGSKMVLNKLSTEFFLRDPSAAMLLTGDDQKDMKTFLRGLKPYTNYTELMEHFDRISVPCETLVHMCQTALDSYKPCPIVREFFHFGRKCCQTKSLTPFQIIPGSRGRMELNLIDLDIQAVNENISNQLQAQQLQAQQLQAQQLQAQQLQAQQLQAAAGGALQMTTVGCGLNVGLAKTDNCDWSVYFSSHDKATPISDADLTVISKDIAEVQLSEVLYKDLKAPHGNCSDDPPRLQYFESYSYEKCFLEQQFRASFEVCTCVYVGFYFEQKAIEEAAKGNFRFCSYTEALDCSSKSTTMTAVAKLTAQMTFNNCVQDCNQTKYETKVHLFSGRLGILETVYSKSAPKASDKDRLTKVGVYFPQFARHVSEKTIAVTPFDLISKVGGAFSLWLGFKLMTVLQIFYYVGWWLLRRCRGGQNEPSMPPGAPPAPIQRRSIYRNQIDPNPVQKPHAFQYVA